MPPWNKDSRIGSVRTSVLAYMDATPLSSWLIFNYLQVNGDKTQAMILGNSSYRYDLEFTGTSIDIKDHLKILGTCLDNKLSFKERIERRKKEICKSIC